MTLQYPMFTFSVQFTAPVLVRMLEWAKKSPCDHVWDSAVRWQQRGAKPLIPLLHHRNHLAKLLSGQLFFAFPYILDRGLPLSRIQGDCEE